MTFVELVDGEENDLQQFLSAMTVGFAA